MNSNEVLLSSTYHCHPTSFSSVVMGKVIKKLERTAIVQILEYNTDDEDLVNDKQGIALVRYENFEQVSDLVFDCQTKSLEIEKLDEAL